MKRLGMVLGPVILALACATLMLASGQLGPATVTATATRHVWATLPGVTWTPAPTRRPTLTSSPAPSPTREAALIIFRVIRHPTKTSTPEPTPDLGRW